MFSPRCSSRLRGRRPDGTLTDCRTRHARVIGSEMSRCEQAAPPHIEAGRSSCRRVRKQATESGHGRDDLDRRCEHDQGELEIRFRVTKELKEVAQGCAYQTASHW
jgi:hypothetical protein